MIPVDVQIREDAALGAAWRRCEAALPEGWGMALHPQPYTVEMRYLAGASADGQWSYTVSGSTPTAALEALADRLEASDG